MVLQKTSLRPPRYNVAVCDDVQLPILLYSEFHSQSLSTLFPTCANSCTLYMKPKYRNVSRYSTGAIGSNCSEDTVTAQIIAECHPERYLSVREHIVQLYVLCECA